MNPKTKQIISEAFYREYEWGEKRFIFTSPTFYPGIIIRF